MLNLPTFNTTITVYNRHYDEQTHNTEWQRTVLNNCSLLLKSAGNDNDLMTRSVTKGLCKIDRNERYIPKKQWDNLPYKERTEYFTFAVGDLIFKGSISEEIEEQTAGKRAADLIEKYNTVCFVIDIFTDNTLSGILPHYRLEGDGGGESRRY